MSKGKDRRKRSDSTEAKVAAFQRVTDVSPPSFVKLSEEELPYWEAIMATKGIWTENDKVLAAQLAKIQREIAYYSELVSGGKRVVTSGEKVKVSPIHKVLEDLIATQMSLCRSLQIHSRATQGESRNQVKQNQLHHEAREILNSKSHLIKGL